MSLLCLSQAFFWQALFSRVISAKNKDALALSLKDPTEGPFK